MDLKEDQSEKMWNGFDWLKGLYHVLTELI